MHSSDFDVAVIGAGAAGLCAAADLCRSGCSVVLLEARERIGGRIYTHRSAALPYPIELGAEFIHGEAPVTTTLLRAAGVLAVDATGTRLSRHGSDVSSGDHDFHDMERLLLRASSLQKDESVARFLGHCQGEFAPETVEMARMMVEGFDAADPETASVKAIAEEWSGSGLEGQARPLGGYSVLLSHLSRELDPSKTRLMLGTAVETVQWGSSTVRLQARNAGGVTSLNARRAIVTLPVSLLKEEATERTALRFEPPLRAKEAALRGLSTGPVIKVVLQFRRAFWGRIAPAAVQGCRVHAYLGRDVSNLMDIVILAAALSDRLDRGSRCIQPRSKGRGRRDRTGVEFNRPDAWSRAADCAR